MKTKIYSLAEVGIFLMLIILLLPSSVSASTVVSGSILENTTWTVENSPYVVNGTLSIPTSITLTIDFGVVVKFMHTQSKMDVYGTLLVNGTNGNNVYFTSYKDDEVGGDTNGDSNASTPLPKDWRQIIIHPSGNANFELAVIRYGGNTAFNCPNYSCSGAINNRGILNFSNSQIYQTGKYGIYQGEGSANINFSKFSGNTERGIYANGNLSVSDSFFSNQIHTGIMMSGNGNLGLNDNNFENNLRDVYVNATVNFKHSNNTSESGNGRGFYISGTTGSNTVWTKDNMPYIVEGTISIPTDNILTIEPGVVMKFAHNQSKMDVYGTLNAEGAEENKIYFTSLKDDEIGGDTNGNGNATLPAENDWRRIIVRLGANANIDNAVIKYGGYRQTGCFWVICLDGVINNAGTLNISNSEISENGKYGIYQTDGNTTIHNSSILNHTNYGIFNDSANIIDAADNWWGDPTGPYHSSLNTNGLGNRVSDKVNFESWLQQEPSQIDPLILKYEPILYFHENERFFPMNVEAFVSNSSLWKLNGSHELIKDESDVNPVGPEDLTPLGQDTVNYYLQFSEGLIDKNPDPVKANTEYQELVGSEESHNTYYAYRSEDSYLDEEGNQHEFIVLQYWYFYAFNDWKYHGGINNHEGDWEVMMLFLNKDTEEPEYVAYSSHHNEGEIVTDKFQYDSVRRSWSSNEINKEDNQVISFVALGSHANYPNNGDVGEHKVPPIYNDITSYGGNHLYTDNWIEKNIFNENNFPLWLTDFEGLWGVNNIKDEGPQGPYYRTGKFGDQINLFHNPIEWAGIDNIGKKTVTQVTKTLNFLKQGAKFVFDNALEIGTKMAVDLHNEIISFGSNVDDVLFSPYFWDITSSLENYTFGVQVSFNYDKEELSSLGINENYLTVFYYNDTSNIWETTPSVVDINNSSVSFFTNHFSRYAIGMEIWQDITENIKIKKNKKYYDPKTGTRHVSIEIKKEKDQQIIGNLRFLIENITEDGVKLLNPTGFTNDGIPYVEVNGLDNQCLKAVDLEFSMSIEKINESQSLQNEVSTYVPELLKFDFDVRVLIEN